MAGAGLWSDDKVDEIEVFDVISGRVNYSARLLKHDDGGQTVEWANGHVTVIPRPPGHQRSSRQTSSLLEPNVDCYTVCSYVETVGCAVIAVFVCAPCEVVGICAIICAVAVATYCFVAIDQQCTLICNP